MAERPDGSSSSEEIISLQSAQTKINTKINKYKSLASAVTSQSRFPNHNLIQCPSCCYYLLSPKRERDGKGARDRGRETAREREIEGESAGRGERRGKIERKKREEERRDVGIREEEGGTER